MNDVIYVYMKEPKVSVLGPGERYVLWVQGCNKSCPGCVAENAHDMKAGSPIDIGALAMEIALSGSDGLTISGGEPFLQAAELAEMIDRVRRFREMGVIVYTGYRYEELLDDPECRDLLSKTDILIDGPYIKELDDGKSLRGSSNQRVICLTDKYNDYLELYGKPGRCRETFNHGIVRHEIGIPDDRE